MLIRNSGLGLFIGVLLAIVLQSTALALTVSDLQLNSYLNQLFDAKVQFSSVTSKELDNLSLRVIPVDKGGHRESDWPDINIKIVRDDQGEHFLHFTSSKPVIEPVLSFILELDWSEGRIQREYVLLIDPKLR